MLLYDLMYIYKRMNEARDAAVKEEQTASHKKAEQSSQKWKSKSLNEVLFNIHAAFFKQQIRSVQFYFFQCLYFSLVYTRYIYMISGNIYIHAVVIWEGVL